MTSKNRLWRVDIISKAGYQAPYFIVETSAYLKYKAESEAISIAKERSRLSDFGNDWTFTAVCLEKKKDYSGKWYVPDTIEE